MSNNALLDFFERAYFAELERKNKLYTALSFPVSIMTVGTGLYGYLALNFEFPKPAAVLVFALLLIAFLSFVFFVVSASQFLIGRTYKYIWKLEEALRHKAELDAFCKQWPDAPSAMETFNEHLIQTIAFCASHNATLNDQRSENLYRANILALTYVVIAVLISIILIYQRMLR